MRRLNNALKNIMKTKVINVVAKGINERRNNVKTIISDYLAMWTKVYKSETLDAYKSAKAANDKERTYYIETILAKAKSINLSNDEKDNIRDMYENDGLRFETLSLDFLVSNLEAPYISETTNANGEKVQIIMERKKDKETGETYYAEIEKWTVLKLARYFRLACICRESK